jgi:putative ABC transport system permease protein
MKLAHDLAFSIIKTMWGTFIKSTIRLLLRHRSFTLVNILGLSFSLAIFTSLALYIQHELSFDKFHSRADRIYRIEQLMQGGGRIERMVGTPTPLWQVLEDDFREVEASIRWIPFRRIMSKKGGESFNASVAYVEENFLEVFDFTVLAGDPGKMLSEPLTMVLTESTAKKLFGDEEAVGMTYQADGVVHTVAGIIQDPPSNSHIDFDLLISVSTLNNLYGDDTFTYWGNNWVSLYVLMREKTDMEDFNAKILPMLKEYRGEDNEDELYTRPLMDIHLQSDLGDDYAVRGNINNLYILVAIAVFILIMSGVNFTNLSIAYSSLRIREIGIRKINGGSRRLLLGQLLGESLVVSMVSILLAFVIFESFLPVFNHLVNRELSFRYLDNFPLLAFILGVGLTTGMLSALYPAVLLSGFRPINIVQAGRNGMVKGPVLRHVLVGLQFLISAAMIISTLGVVRQASYMKNKDLGYNPRNIIQTAIADSSWSHLNTFRELLLQNPRVLDVAYHDYPVCQSSNWTTVTWEGAQEDQFIRMNVNYADHHYLHTYEMKFLEGENFKDLQRGRNEGEKLLVLNEAAVRMLEMQDPVGKYILYGLDYRQGGVDRVKIAGIIEDYHFLSVHNVIMPIMIRLFHDQLTPQTISIRLNGIDDRETIRYIRELFSEHYPELPFNHDYIYDFHARMYEEEDRMSNIVLALAVLSIIIACLGVYGLVAFATSNRTREVGIRRVMGAGFFSIGRVFSREFLILICLANLLAWPAGYFLVSNWMQNFPYRIDFSTLPYLAALFLTLFFAMASMLFHIYRSTRMQPADSLRYE